jgi:hypothetical protein
MPQIDTGTANTQPQSPSGQSQGKKQSPDLKALAEIVLRLIKEESRQELDRRGRRR